MSMIAFLVINITEKDESSLPTFEDPIENVLVHHDKGRKCR